jgi:hypothetical protein
MGWCTDTITNFEKEALRTGPFKQWYDRLGDKWKEPTTVTVKQVLSATDKDIAAHIYHGIWHTKPANTSDHYAQLSIIHRSIRPMLRRPVPGPTPDTTGDSSETRNGNWWGHYFCVRVSWFCWRLACYSQALYF